MILTGFQKFITLSLDVNELEDYRLETIANDIFIALPLPAAWCVLVCDSTFCIVDSDSTCFSVTVYNMVRGWGVKIGDSVAIPEPYLQRVDVCHQDQVNRIHL